MVTINDMPAHVLTQVFSKLRPGDIVAAHQSCKILRDASRRDDVWLSAHNSHQWVTPTPAAQHFNSRKDLFLSHLREERKCYDQCKAKIYGIRSVAVLHHMPLQESLGDTVPHSEYLQQLYFRLYKLQLQKKIFERNFNASNLALEVGFLCKASRMFVNFLRYFRT